MEKSTTTHYVIIANEHELKFLFRQLQILVHAKRTGLKTVANLICPEWKNFEIKGYFHDLVRCNSRKITFVVTAEKNTGHEIWYRLCRRYLTATLTITNNSVQPLKY